MNLLLSVLILLVVCVCLLPGEIMEKLTNPLFNNQISIYLSISKNLAIMIILITLF